MITKSVVLDHLLNYLNQKTTLAALVAWAEHAFVVGGFTPDDDIPELRAVIADLAAADTSAFPLTWEACLAMMRHLGTSVEVVARESM